MTVRIGTRASKLALWQTHYVADLLKQAGLQTEIKTFKTTGDKILDKPLAAIGSKGLFTAELEEALLNREIDLAVHSAKDLPTTFAPNLKIIAFTNRHRAQRCLIKSEQKFRFFQASENRNFFESADCPNQILLPPFYLSVCARKFTYADKTS